MDKATGSFPTRQECLKVTKKDSGVPPLGTSTEPIYVLESFDGDLARGARYVKVAKDVWGATEIGESFCSSEWSSTNPLA